MRAISDVVDILIIYKTVTILFKVIYTDDLKQQKSFYKHERIR